MGESTSTTEFQFVNSTIDAPKVPQDLAVRALIRKQAMKKASAARRRDGNYGKHNLRQYPVFLFDEKDVVNKPIVPEAKIEEKEIVYQLDHTRRADSNVDVAIADANQKYRKAKEWQEGTSKYEVVEHIPRGLSAKGYELTSMKSDFDIIDLSTLSTLHYNRAARAALSRNPYHLIYQLRAHKQSSYLSYLPSRYGQVACLSHATDCVIARARQIISPNRGWESAVITFYLKALDSLQKALDSPKQRYKPEVLCATEILALYEGLDPSGETAWVKHAAGAARLVQLRGPKNYTTEFERALLMAHTGAIMTECLLNNERCFLEAPAWKAVMRSSIMYDDDLIADRSEIVVELMILKSNIPGFFVDVTRFMLTSRPDRDTINETAFKIIRLRDDLFEWKNQYDHLLSTAPSIYPGSAGYDRNVKVLATYLSCVIISSRLLGVLSPTERVRLEEETRNLAIQMLDLELEVKSNSAAAALFMSQTLGVAQATLATSESWLDGEQVAKLESISPEGFTSVSPESDGREEPTGLIDFWKFEKYNKMCGRKMF